MSRWPTDAVGLGLAPWHRRAWQRVSRLGVGCGSAQHVLYLHAQGAMSWPVQAAGKLTSECMAFADFSAWCAAHPASEVRIFVASHLLHSLVVPPEVRVADDAALRRYAQQQFSHYHGVLAKQWPMAVWMRPARWSWQAVPRASAGACALHGVDLPAMLATAASRGVRMLSVAPMWSAGLRSATSHMARRWPTSNAAAPRALALIENQVLTWLVLQRSAILAVQQRYLDETNGPAVAALLHELSQDATLGPTGLRTPPAVVGWGWTDRTHAAWEAAHVLSPSSPGLAASEWMLDRVGHAA